MGIADKIIELSVKDLCIKLKEFHQFNTKALGCLERKFCQVFAFCTGTALDSLKRKFFSLLLKTWRLRLLCTVLKSSELHFKEKWWKWDLGEDDTEGTFPEKFFWFERLFNHNSAVGNFILARNAFSYRWYTEKKVNEFGLILCRKPSTLL